MKQPTVGSPARRPRVSLVVLAATAVVVVALVVGGVLAQRRSPVAEPQATSSLASASPDTTAPASSPAATSVLSDQFGFVWASQRGASGVNVQPERGQGGFQLPTQEWRFSACSCAASPDGTRIAYWAGSTPATIELRVVDVARPGLGTAIYKPPADQRWSALAWSSDGNGILFSLEGWPNPGDPVGIVTRTSLVVIEATGGTARTLATGDSLYVPLGWDRAAGVVAAGLSGEGGYMIGYITARTNGDPAPQRTPMPGQIGMLSVRVSSDQRFILAVFPTAGQSSTVRWWRLADAGAVSTGPRVTAPPTWRPLSSQIGWVENGMLQLLDVERGVTTSGGAFPPGDYPTVAFRVDGSAVAAGPVLMDIATGGGAALAAPGHIVGSVRFGAAPSPTQPPLNGLEVKVIDALGRLGIAGRRAQLPFRDASIWADLGAGSQLFVNAYPLGTVDRHYIVIDERQLAGTRVQHVRRPSYPDGTTSRVRRTLLQRSRLPAVTLSLLSPFVRYFARTLSISSRCSLR